MKTKCSEQLVTRLKSLQFNIFNILSRVYGSVTNNNGFWMDDCIYEHFLVQSLLITINYKTHIRSSAELFFLACWWLAPFSFSFYDSLLTWNSVLYSLETDPTENTVSQQFVGVFTAPLSRKRRPIVPRCAFAGTCLPVRCLVMGTARTTQKALLTIPYCCARVFRALSRGRSTCHNIYHTSIRHFNIILLSTSKSPNLSLSFICFNDIICTSLFRTNFVCPAHCIHCMLYAVQYFLI
jgi:hypothetical protein